MTRWPTHSLAVLALAVALVGPVHAQQYESEVRELESVPDQSQAPLSDAARIEAVQGDPYALALTLRELAAKAVREERADLAAEYLQRAIDQNALSSVVQDQMKLTMGQLYQQTGDYDKVIRELGPRVSANSESDAELRLAVANAYAQTGRFRQALPLVKSVYDEGKPTVAVMQLYAVCLLETGQLNAASPILERLVRADPSNREGWIRLAAVQVQRQDFDRAAAVLELAHRQGMLTEPADKRKLVRMFMRAGAPYEAAALLQGWIDVGIMPADAETLRVLAQAWSTARESRRAIDALERLSSEAPSGGVYLQLGRLLMEQDRWADASAALSRALQLGGKDVPTAQTLTALGLARYQNADIEGALRAFRQAGQSRSQRRVANQWISYLESGKAREQALAAASRAVARSDNDAASTRFSGGQTVSLASAASRPQVEPGPTRIGAERAGNASGSLPPWTGGLTDTAGLERIDGRRPTNPFADEQPKYVIDQNNYTEYSGLLSAGHQEMLRRYNDYKMQVYPSHRTVAYSDAIEAATEANASRAKLLESDSLTGARLGFPFPDPATGAEVMWNHRVRPRGKTQEIFSDEAVVEPDGDYDIRPRTENSLYIYGNQDYAESVDDNNMLLYYVTFVNNVPVVGRAIAVVHETADQTRDRRRIWVGAGLGRMRRIPPVGFDFPRPGSDGIAYVDQIDMYNGSFNRYVWRLRGRREMLVPYNSYDINSPELSYETLLQPGHLNQDYARYERHRVWVVEATERAPARHKLGKRVFYVDEDSWAIVMVDVYDRAGNLLQLQEGHIYYDWQPQVTMTAPIVHYDFQRNAYYINRMLNQSIGVKFNEADFRPGDFRSSVVRTRFR